MAEEEILQELFDMCERSSKRLFQAEDKPRIRELGFLLYEIGGHELMCDIRDQLDQEQEQLEYIWKNIGDWE